MAVSGDIHYDGERISTANERKAKMKTLNLVLLAVMVAVTGYAQETKVELPKALLKAQEAYRKEAASVLEPVNMNYLRTLESLKRDMGVKGDTVGMVAVQKEIDEIKEYLKNETGTEGMLVGTKWKKENQYVWEFRKNGVVFCPNNGHFAKWEIKGNDLTVSWDEKDIHHLKIDSDGKSASGTSDLEGGPSKIIRVK